VSATPPDADVIASGVTAAGGIERSAADRADDVDPRVERSRRRILEATLDELSHVGYGAMSIESIAKRAGVGKATIYRHWRGKLEILDSALNTMKFEVEIPESASAREQVVAMMTGLVGYLVGSRGGACIPAIVSASQYDPAVRDFHHRFSGQRRAVLVRALRSGVESGEFAPDLDAELAAELLVGPIFYRRLMTNSPYQVDDVAHLVDTVLPPR
jgi:TetR/AcrR family transcriptional regulator, regulator of autoinduction and epiphytic fitness